MINNEEIKKCIDDCKAVGYNITTRDISFVILIQHFEDANIAYKCLFGKDGNFNPDYCETYQQTSAIQFLKIYIEQNFSKNNKGKKYEDLSFDENKNEMIKLIKETQQALERGEIDAKDALKIQADLRVKLNNQFNVSDEQKDQVIIVNAKYDAICPSCGREVSRKPITKEEAIKMYNLVEK